MSHMKRISVENRIPYWLLIKAKIGPIRRNMWDCFSTLENPFNFIWIFGYLFIVVILVCSRPVRPVTRLACPSVRLSVPVWVNLKTKRRKKPKLTMRSSRPIVLVFSSKVIGCQESQEYEAYFT